MPRRTAVAGDGVPASPCAWREGAGRRALLVLDATDAVATLAGSIRSRVAPLL
ncbi:hypothetical protein [Mycetocola sp. 2940]|uniref:hypothetical protein n=1 Tax=Mycetocola sp. 2940 TaxID=3156452 RepID=UPI00339A4586